MSSAKSRRRVLFCCALVWASVPVPAKEGDKPLPPGAPRAISVVELPAPLAGLPGGARQRAHHALSIATDAPKPFLRSLGLDATDCALRLRLPSRIAPSRETRTGLRLDVQAQAGLGCRF
jgi:hypothetical protein